jgi:hypothetical protein
VGGGAVIAISIYCAGPCAITTVVVFSGFFAPDTYVRGDSNCDGTVDISDASYTLAFLFLGGPAPCCPAATPYNLVSDTNADGGTDLSDAVYGLNFLFTGGPIIPPPYPACGGGGCPAHPCP